jgi:hypothetical protein
MTPFHHEGTSRNTSGTLCSKYNLHHDTVLGQSDPRIWNVLSASIRFSPRPSRLSRTLRGRLDATRIQLAIVQPLCWVKTSTDASRRQVAWRHGLARGFSASFLAASCLLPMSLSRYIGPPALLRSRNSFQFLLLPISNAKNLQPWRL